MALAVLAAVTPSFSHASCEDPILAPKRDAAADLRPLTKAERNELEDAESAFAQSYSDSLDPMRSAAAGSRPRIELSYEGIYGIEVIGRYGNESNLPQLQRLYTLTYKKSTPNEAEVPVFGEKTSRALLAAITHIERRIEFAHATGMSDRDLETFDSWVEEANRTGFILRLPTDNLTWRAIQLLVARVKPVMAKFQIIQKYPRYFNESATRMLGIAREQLIKAVAELEKIQTPLEKLDEATAANNEAAYDYLANSKSRDDQELSARYMTLADEKYDVAAMYTRAAAAIRVRGANGTLTTFVEDPATAPAENHVDRRDGASIWVKPYRLTLNLPRWTWRLIKGISYDFAPNEKVFEIHTGRTGVPVEEGPDYAVRWLATNGSHKVKVGIHFKTGDVITVTTRLQDVEFERTEPKKPEANGPELP